VARLVEKLVKSSREDYARLKDYEAEFGPSLADEKDDEAALQVLRSIWALYAEWARDAEQVLARVKDLKASGHLIPEADGLFDDYSFARAQLAMKPEGIIRGMQQIRRGEVIPVEVLRDELRRRRGA
jgi:hypothetical protein